jgi:hypothetical protein
MKYIIILTRLRRAGNNLNLVHMAIPGQTFYTNTFVGYDVPRWLSIVFHTLRLSLGLTPSQVIDQLCVLQNGRNVVDGHLRLIFIISRGFSVVLVLVSTFPIYLNTLLVFNNLSIDSLITLIGLNSPMDYSFSSGVFNLPSTILTLPTPTVISFSWVPYQPIILQPPFEYGIMSQLNPIVIEPEVNYAELMRDLLDLMNETSNHSGAPGEK